jgi:pyruvate,water dikinase
MTRVTLEKVEGKWWVVDSVASARYPIHCRGNVGEVFPNVVSPLSGSLAIRGAARGQERWAIEYGMASAEQLRDSDNAMTPIFGGYMYGNVSIARLMAVRAPGMKLADIDEQLYGITGAPPYASQKGDRNLFATLRMGRKLGRSLVRPSIAENSAARADIAAWRATLPPIPQATNDELVDVIRSADRWFERMMYLLLVASAGAGMSRTMLERVVDPLGEPGLANVVTAGLGTVESAQPAQVMWLLGRMVRHDALLTSMFDEGTGGLNERLAKDEGAAEFVAAFATFLADHGARGPNEWELASATWGTDPDIALASIDRLRHAPDSRDPIAAERRLAADRIVAVERVRTRLRGPKRVLFIRAVRGVEIYGPEREATKAAFMRAIEPARHAVFELARRLRVSRDEMTMVTIDELPAFAADPAPFRTRIEERRERRDFLQARVPPFWFDGEIPSPDTWPLRSERIRLDASERVLSGMGVCPGVASGRARVVLDPADPRELEPGDVLVAPLTDPAWTPLFLAVTAVVVDVGAQQSHAAIIARELGIPAVVSVADASSTIADGTWLTVDGTNGTVTVHAAAPEPAPA